MLIGLETLAPGILLLWLGIAAFGVFLLLLVGLPLSLLAQIIAFVLLSFVTVGLFWKYLPQNRRSKRPASAEQDPGTSGRQDLESRERHRKRRGQGEDR